MSKWKKKQETQATNLSKWAHASCKPKIKNDITVTQWEHTIDGEKGKISWQNEKAEKKSHFICLCQWMISSSQF